MPFHYIVPIPSTALPKILLPPLTLIFELPRIGLDSRAELTLRGLTGICFSLFPLPPLPPEVKLLFFKRFPFPSVHALSLFTAAAAAAAAAVKKNIVSVTKVTNELLCLKNASASKSQCFSPQFSWWLQNGPQDFDFFNCHECQTFNSAEIHCYISALS